MHISNEDQSKFNPKSKKCVFIGYTKGVSGFKFRDLVLKKMVINKTIVNDDQFMLNQSFAPYVSTSKGETFNNEVIQMDIYPLLVSNMWVVREP